MSATTADTGSLAQDAHSTEASGNGGTLVDSDVRDALAAYLIDGEKLLWAQPSLKEPIRTTLFKSLTRLFWLLVGLLTFGFGVWQMASLMDASGWPTWNAFGGFVLTLIAFVIMSVSWNALFDPDVSVGNIYAISDRRIFAFRETSADRTSIVGTGAIRGSVHVNKSTQNIGTLSLTFDHPAEEEIALIIHRVREVDAAERLILENFVASKQEADT